MVFFVAPDCSKIIEFNSKTRKGMVTFLFFLQYLIVNHKIPVQVETSHWEPWPEPRGQASVPAGPFRTVPIAPVTVTGTGTEFPSKSVVKQQKVRTNIFYKLNSKSVPKGKLTNEDYGSGTYLIPDPGSKCTRDNGRNRTVPPPIRHRFKYDKNKLPMVRTIYLNMNESEREVYTNMGELGTDKDPEPDMDPDPRPGRITDCRIETDRTIKKVNVLYCPFLGYRTVRTIYIGTLVIP